MHSIYSRKISPRSKYTDGEPMSFRDFGGAQRVELRAEFRQLPAHEIEVSTTHADQEIREMRMGRAALFAQARLALGENAVPAPVPALEPVPALQDAGAEAPGAQLALVDAGAWAVRPLGERIEKRGAVVLYRECARCRLPPDQHPGLPPLDVSQALCLPSDVSGDLALRVGSQEALAESLHPSALPSRFEQHQNTWPACSKCV